MIYSKTRRFNADTYTPVQLYLILRNQFRNCCLLESNDYHSRQDSRSFIGFDPLVSIVLKDGDFEVNSETHTETIPLNSCESKANQVQRILDGYNFEHAEHNGFFGRMSFEFTHSDETHIQDDSAQSAIPQLHLFLFRFIIVIDHFSNEGILLENSCTPLFQNLTIESLLRLPAPTELPFETVGKESAMFSDEAFTNIVKRGVSHCERGDVFQLVLSNKFEQPYFGDDFHVYRQLRRTNPSPFLFYFDFEAYRLFGSSPEAQTVVKNEKVEIHPIAGTVPKTGDSEVDEEQLKFLQLDDKENAEHIMLVDLARNDISRCCTEVEVESLKEVQHFSHVIHLVSKVTGTRSTDQTFNIICQGFPAGTLSGAPKPHALELINTYETAPREFYGGAIGILQPNGDANMAIVIRSVLSRENRLYYQAGAGIVLDSNPERETNEVHHKLRAVRQAIQKANDFQSETEKIQAL